MGKVGTDEIQGNEVRMYLQAPTETQIDEMISDLRQFARENKMYTIEVSDKQKDHDGGWEAEFKAHNFNPFKWVRRRKELKGKSESEQIRLKQYYRREDMAGKAVRRQKREKREAEKQARLIQKAEREEAKTRIEEARYNRRVYRRGSGIGNKPATSIRRVYAGSRDVRISPRERRITPRERPIMPREHSLSKGSLW